MRMKAIFIMNETFATLCRKSHMPKTAPTDPPTKTKLNRQNSEILYWERRAFHLSIPKRAKQAILMTVKYILTNTTIHQK